MIFCMITHDVLYTQEENIMGIKSFSAGRPDDKNKGTFLIKVNSSDSGTWQGNVLWADKNQSEHFRSGLELLNLIDKAMDGSGKREATG